MNVRFQVVSLPRPGFTTYNIVDVQPGHLHTLCTTLDYADAILIASKLNDQTTLNPRWRQLLAMELMDFRMKLELENCGPLVQYPEVVLFLDDLCRFLNFTTGEKSLVLGASLLVYLCFLDTVPPDSIEIFETDSTITV